MFRDYLESSSVHGLVYLSEAKDKVSKAVWFACIATSFSVAVYVNYSSFVQWENNPTMISSYRKVKVEVRKEIDAIPILMQLGQQLLF